MEKCGCKMFIAEVGGPGDGERIIIERCPMHQNASLYQGALQRLMSELGVPNTFTPAPVDNAWHIAQAALEGKRLELEDPEIVDERDREYAAAEGVSPADAKALRMLREEEH